MRTPRRYVVVGEQAEGRAGTLLTLEPLETPIAQPLPGQYCAVTVLGGAAQLSATVSVLPDPVGRLGLTLAVPELRRAGVESWLSQVVEVQGPFGTGWDFEPAMGGDLLMIASERGMSALLPALATGAAQPRRHPRQMLVVETRRVCRLPFTSHVGAWYAPGTRTVTAVTDGRVVQTLAALVSDPDRCLVLVAAGLPTVRAVGRALCAWGVPGPRIQVSLQPRIRCVDASCGRCQVGGVIPCVDGPVVPFRPR